MSASAIMRGMTVMHIPRETMLAADQAAELVSLHISPACFFGLVTMIYTCSAKCVYAAPHAYPQCYFF